MAEEGDIRVLATVLVPFISEELKKSENRQHLKGIQGVFELTVLQKGQNKGTWHIILKGDKEEPIIKEGKAQKPTLALTIEDEVLIKIGMGKQNPITAFMSGKLKLSGNIMLAQRLEATFRKAQGYERARPFILQFAESNSYIKSKL